MTARSATQARPTKNVSSSHRRSKEGLHSPPQGSMDQVRSRQGLRVAVFTGSFDPITLGHEDVIRRACRLFDRVVVGVGVAHGKNPLFSIEQRVKLLKAVCHDLPQVEVYAFSGLAVDFAREKEAALLVRGIRSTSDYAYEVQMALMNRAMAPDIETVFIPTSPEFSHISSSLAKEIALHGGNPKLLVPDLVAQSLLKVMTARRKS